MKDADRARLAAIKERASPCEIDDGCLDCANHHCFARVGISGDEHWLDCDCQSQDVPWLVELVEQQAADDRRWEALKHELETYTLSGTIGPLYNVGYREATYVRTAAMERLEHVAALEAEK